MSGIKALEMMKAALESCRHTEENDPPFDTYWITVDACNACIKELEAEIAERFMELPVDADGVPIRMGDTVEGEPIVRCRDCELFAIDGRWGVCTQFDFEKENMRDGFCAWGERKGE